MAPETFLIVLFGENKKIEPRIYFWRNFVKKKILFFIYTFKLLFDYSPRRQEDICLKPNRF